METALSSLPCPSALAAWGPTPPRGVLLEYNLFPSRCWVPATVNGPQTQTDLGRVAFAALGALGAAPWAGGEWGGESPGCSGGSVQSLTAR